SNRYQYGTDYGRSLQERSVTCASRARVDANETGADGARSWVMADCVMPSRTRDDVHLHRRLHVGVQRNFDVVIAEVVDRAFRHDHFALFRRDALRGERFGDV